MTLIQILAMGESTSREAYFGMQPIPSAHPPSLRRPQGVRIPVSSEGWQKGASQAARRQAMADLGEIHKRMLRQTGKPVVSQVAQYPLFPNYREIT